MDQSMNAGVSRLTVVLDAELEVKPQDLLEAWLADEQASRWGLATLEPASSHASPLQAMDVLVVPLEVNLASALIYDVVHRVITHTHRDREGVELEITEATTAVGRVVMVRQRRERS